MEYKDFCESTARKAGEIMKKYFYATDHISYKVSFNEIVTVADQEINQLVIDEVAKVFPEHDVMGEEGDGVRKDAKYIWITDPIDGTIPYSRNIPISVFSLALMFDGKPIVGCVYQPFLDEMYYAEKGKGATLNEKPIRVSTKDMKNRNLLIGDCTWKADPFKVKPFYDQLFDMNICTIDLGPVTYMGALVAKGSLDAVLFPHVKPFDLPAVKVLVEEAGGKESDLFGDQQRFDGPIKGNIVSNGVIHDEIVQMLGKYDLSL